MKKGTTWLFRVLLAFSVLGLIVSGIGCWKKAAAVSIIGGADGPTSIFIAGKINSTPVYVVTALFILATAVTGLIIRKQNKKKGGGPEK